MYGRLRNTILIIEYLSHNLFYCDSFNGFIRYFEFMYGYRRVVCVIYKCVCSTKLRFGYPYPCMNNVTLLLPDGVSSSYFIAHTQFKFEDH